MFCLGLLDPFMDQGRLVGTGGRERLEREPLRFLCFSFPGLGCLQILGGLGQLKTPVLLAGMGPVQNPVGVPQSQPGDTRGRRLSQGALVGRVPAS